MFGGANEAVSYPRLLRSWRQSCRGTRNRPLGVRSSRYLPLSMSEVVIVGVCMFDINLVCWREDMVLDAQLLTSSQFGGCVGHSTGNLACHNDS